MGVVEWWSREVTGNLLYEGRNIKSYYVELVILRHGRRESTGQDKTKTREHGVLLKRHDRVTDMDVRTLYCSVMYPYNTDNLVLRSSVV